MSEFKGTPGDFQIGHPSAMNPSNRRFFNADGIYSQSEDDEWNRIASVVGLPSGRTLDEVESDIKKDMFGCRKMYSVGLSNARLFCASKDLLKALQAVLETHCCDTGEVDYRCEWMDEAQTITVCPVCKPAYAAIAKALGEM